MKKTLNEDQEMHTDTAVTQQLVSLCNSTLLNMRRTAYKSINTAELTQIILVKKLQDELAKKI